MKQILLSLALLSGFFLSAGPEKMPPVVGKTGPEIILFNGSRPRMGNIFSEKLEKAGARALNVNGTYLDGFGGSTIKVNMTDKVEPVPFNGITPALNALEGKALVMFQDIPANLLKAMLTPERIAQLRGYVEKGGHLLFTLDCPEQIGDLLPAVVGPLVKVEGNLTANRPAAPIFQIYPENLPVYKQYHQLTLAPGAEVLSMIRNEKGEEITPYLVRKQMGKGTVTFFNGEFTYAHELKEFTNWAYGVSFLMAIASDCGQIPLDCRRFIEKMQEIPPRTPVDTVTVSVKPPELRVIDCTKPPRKSGRKITFPNGCIVKFDFAGNVTVTYPGEKEPLIRNYTIPEIAFSAERTFYDAKTAEATDGEAAVTAADIKWEFQQVKISGNQAVAVYKAKNSEMHWIFTAGTLKLDGREFAGVADQVKLLRSPLHLNEIVFHSQLTPEDPLFARRFSCYSPPRGYSDFDMSGATTADTFTWRYLGSGQPFELLTCKDGVYLGNMEEAEAVIVRFTRKKGAPSIENLRRHTMGWITAPCQTTRYWHWFSRGPERGHNDYLAMYQFVRQDLRRRAGLMELPAYPQGHVTHQSTPKEQQLVMEAAAKAGFRFFALPGCEEPPDASYNAKRFPTFQKVLQMGMGSHIWTAGSYVQGDGGWIYNNHPEWFVRDSKGKIFCYGNGRYPVIDVNNEEFYQWYCDLAKKAIDAGVRWVYRDMDGAAANCINYALKESPHGNAAQIRYYKFFQENGCRVSIEGMNPLVLDEYWYRPHLYTPFAGNEFCLVGGVPSVNFYEGLELDFFRTGMYGSFPNTELSGYTFQFDRIQDEVKRANRMISLVPKFNEALDQTGMPFIRETEFGTTWIGEKGGALFFWNPAKKVTVELPEGWSIRGVKGNTLTNVPADSIFLLEKAQ